MRIRIRPFVALLGCFLALAFGQWIEGGHLASLMQFAAFVCVFGGAGFLLLLSQTPAEILRGVLGVVVDDQSDETRALTRNVFGQLARLAPLTGLIGAVFGLIHVMENLADPSKLGAGIAVAFISVFYGAVLTGVSVGIEHGAAREPSRGAVSSADSSVVVPSMFAMTGLLTLMLAFFVVMYAVSAVDRCQSCAPT